MIEDYFRDIEALLGQSGIVVASRMTYDKRTSSIGFLRGEVYFVDASCLHIREYVNVEQGVNRYMYAYHYRGADGSLIFRYDNTPHFLHLPSFPHHKHVGSESHVIAAQAPNLKLILSEIQQLLI